MIDLLEFLKGKMKYKRIFPLLGITPRKEC